jgi:murein DD-endopeptidase MepM/ murein hydrolase activator NlpD
MMSNRLPAVLISSVYLFSPLIFFPGELFQGITVAAHAYGPSGTPLSQEKFQDMVSGKGGPEVQIVIDENGEQTIQLGSTGVFGDVSTPTVDAKPRVRVTRTVNQLKVANTSWPVAVPDVSSDYGWRSPPCDGCSSDHRGVDFVPGYGEDVMAVADGLVVEMGNKGGYGFHVRMQHFMTNSDGELETWETLYAHMKPKSFPEGLRRGSSVEEGEKIGEVGSTGLSTGPHLHFELLINGKHVDPMPLLGTYQILQVIETENPDHLFAGETLRVFEEFVRYD